MSFRIRSTALLGATSLLTLSACASVGNDEVASNAAPAIATPLSAPLNAETTTQLPRNAVPTHYAIIVTPDADSATFTGEVKTNFDLLQTSNSITMNAADLAINKATLTNNAGIVIPAKVAIDAAAQTVTFSFDSVLEPGHYVFDASYSGKIYDQANGLFHLDYKNPEGVDKRALFTQFEAPDARRFAPMWDEPSYKATFDLTANVPADLMAVSNMPIQSSALIDGGKKRVVFATSPKMSSYLLFFGVGEFGRINQQVGDTDVGIIMGKGNEEKARYALKSAVDLLPFYEEYFGVEYALPKLDNVAGPGQSQFFSAMENWGAIFSFEAILLNDPKVTTESGRQNIYATNAHEMAHQWFGNYVTMSWWDDLWLNEGFASWMETKATAHFNPEWDVELTRVRGRERAMGLDAFKTTHPVVQKIKTVEQISQAFDAITYSKGEAVITMLENYAGEDVWRTGIRAYMKKHAYANTVTNDLWGAVENAGATGLVTIANDYTSKPGIPLIAVSNAVCDNGRTRLTLKQGEYSRDRKGAPPLAWNVPVVAKSVGGTAARTIVTGGTGTITVPGCTTAIVNAGQAGYYRTLYAPAMLTALTRNFATLDTIDQLGLIYDQSALAEADYQPYAPVLAMIHAAPTKGNPVVTGTIADQYDKFYNLFDSEPKVQAKIAQIANARLLGELNRLGYDPKPGEKSNDAILRSNLISVLGNMGNAAIHNEAKRRFVMLDNNPNALDGPMRSTWLNLIAYNADKAVWDKIHALAKAENNKQARSGLYAMLASAKDPALARAALDLALTPEPGPTDSPEMIVEVASNHPDMTLDFALAHRATIEKMVDASSRSRFIARLAGRSSKADAITKLEDYATRNLTPESRKPVDQSIASIQSRIESRKRSVPQIRNWFLALGSQ